MNWDIATPFAKMLAEKLRSYESRDLFCRLYAPKILIYIEIEREPYLSIASMFEAAIRHYDSLAIFEDGFKRLFPDEDFSELKNCKLF